MATLQSYKKYKSVDLNFAKQIPIDWTLKRGKFFFKEISERSKKGEEQLLSVSEHKGIVPRDSINVTMFQALSYEGYKLCNKGDIVINSLWAWHRGLGVSEHHGIVSTAYGVYRPLRPEQWNHRYLNYLIRDKTYVGECLIRSKGIWESRYLLSGRNFLDIPILQPPLEVQNGIVAYLDKKNSEIDKFISGKIKLIESLKELKNQIIEKLVTKGTNNEVSFKDSGLKLFGDVPLHWKVKRLRYVSRKVKTGTTPSGKLKDYYDEGHYNWFTPGDFNSDYLLLESEKKVNTQALKDNEVTKFPANSVLIIGIGGTIGKVGLIKSEASSNQQVNSITFNKEIEPVYGLHLLGLIGRNLLNILDFTTLPILNQGATKDLLFIAPPINEQRTIIEEISRISESTKESIMKIEKEILSIKEYREALITDLVTGKRSLNCDLE
jgi:type I restriction enzyme S subunit